MSGDDACVAVRVAVGEWMKPKPEIRKAKKDKSHTKARSHEDKSLIWQSFLRVLRGFVCDKQFF